MSAVAERPRTIDALDMEERAAWDEYLRTLRELAEPNFRYDEVEPWAWNRLLVKRNAINARRAALKTKAKR